MALSIHDLFAPITLPGAGDALGAWRWLTGPEPAAWLVTALGDVFVKYGDGRIAFVDTYEGTLHDVAAASTGWTRALQDPGSLDRWFDPRLVTAIRARGLVLGPEQCYSPIQPLVLGGVMEPGNFEVGWWTVHSGLMGQVMEQLRRG